MSKMILTDCDGVLINWIYAFNCWMEERGHKSLREDTYSIADRFGITLAEERGLIKIFNESAAIGFLPPLRDAMHYVRKLHEEHGYVFRVITSLSKNPYAKKLRIRNLEKLFGTAIDDVVCLDTGAAKDEALEQYRDSGLLWIEDHEHNAEYGQSIGLKSILVRHEYNHTNTNVKLQAHSWKEIYEIISKQDK